MLPPSPFVRRGSFNFNRQEHNVVKELKNGSLTLRLKFIRAALRKVAPDLTATGCVKVPWCEESQGQCLGCEETPGRVCITLFSTTRRAMVHSVAVVAPWRPSVGLSSPSAANHRVLPSARPAVRRQANSALTDRSASMRPLVPIAAAASRPPGPKGSISTIMKIVVALFCAVILPVIPPWDPRRAVILAPTSPPRCLVVPSLYSPRGRRILPERLRVALIMMCPVLA